MSDKNSQRKHRGLWAAVSGLAVCAAIGVGAQAPSATAAPVNVTSDVSSVAPESPGGASASDANPRLSNPAPRPRQLETNLLVPWVLGAFPGL